MATTFHIACDSCRCLLALPRLGSEGDQSLVELGEQFTAAHQRLIDGIVGTDWAEFSQFVSAHADHQLVIGSAEAGHGLDYRAGEAVPTFDQWRAAIADRRVAGRLGAAEALPYLTHLDEQTLAEVIRIGCQRLARERSATVFAPLSYGLSALIQESMAQDKSTPDEATADLRRWLLQSLESSNEASVIAGVNGLSLVGEPSDIEPLLHRLDHADIHMGTRLATALFGIASRASRAGQQEVLAGLIGTFEERAGSHEDPVGQMYWLMLLGEAGPPALPALMRLLRQRPRRRGSNYQTLDPWLIRALSKAAAQPETNGKLPIRSEIVTPVANGAILSVVTWRGSPVFAEQEGTVRLGDGEDWKEFLVGSRNQTTLRAIDERLYVLVRDAVIIHDGGDARRVDLPGADGIRIDLTPDAQTVVFLKAGRLAVAALDAPEDVRIFERLPAELRPRTLRVVDAEHVAVGGNGVTVFELAGGSAVEMVDLASVQALEALGGGQLAIATQAGSVHCWNLHSGTVEEITAGTTAAGRFTRHGGGMGATALAFNGRRLAVAGADAVVRVWDPKTAACEFDGSLGSWPLLKTGLCRTVCWRDDEILVGTTERLFRVRTDGAQSVEPGEFKTTQSAAHSAEVENDEIALGPRARAVSGPFTAFAGPEGLTIRTAEAEKRFPELGPLTACCFTPCGRWLISVGWRGEVAWVSSDRLRIERRHAPHALPEGSNGATPGSALLDVDTSPCGRFVAVGGLLGAVSIFDRQHQSYVRAGRNHQITGDCASLTFDGTGSRLFIGAMSAEQVTIVDALSGVVLQDLYWHDGTLPAVRGVWDLTCEGDDLTAWINGEQRRIVIGELGWEIR